MHTDVSRSCFVPLRSEGKGEDNEKQVDQLGALIHILWV